jgi:spermidine synthase
MPLDDAAELTVPAAPAEAAATRVGTLVLPLLVGLLFVSGVSALIYQVLWLRLLSLTFGVTTHAASTVLASFMGGLAVGSVVAGRLADRLRRPLRLFGAVELLIGACALATPLVLAAAHSGYIVVFSRLPDSLAIGTVIRLLMSIAVLIVPTSLMGATMPIVVKAVVTGLDSLGPKIGLLYAANTAGAIGGALLAGFYLIPHVGLTQSFLLAAGLNGIVGAVAFAMAGVRQPTPAAAAIPIDPLVPVSAGSWMVLSVFAVSGFASLALEVVWFRLLGILLGPTSYAFTVMLAAVLAGIALGSALITPVMKLRWDWMQALALLQIGAGLIAIQSLSGLGRVPDLPRWLQTAVAWPGLEFLVPAVAMSIAAILPTAIFFGLAFPVGLRLWAGASDAGGHTAERVGVFYAANTGGAIAGSIASGFILLPALGTRGSLVAMGALFLASGLAIQIMIARRRPVFTFLAALSAILFVTQALEVPDPQRLARRRGLLTGPTLWQEEGAQTTVVVTGSNDLGRMLYLNGRHQANDSEAMVFIHRRIGLLPAVLHPRPRRAMVVGLGGGATAGGLSQFPGIQVDVVELSGEVMRGAAFFSHVNFDVLRRPNVTPRQDDGRNYLLRTRSRYDVITADAILPHHAGSNNLNSVEYFRLVHDRLLPDGVALHWNAGTTEAEHKMILRSFVEAFPLATLWGDGTLMIGTKQPLTVSRSRIESLLAEPETRRVLGLMHVETFDHLVRMFRGNPHDIRVYLGEGPLLTDDRPALEYFASLPQGERDLTRIGRSVEGLVVP